MPKDQLVLDDFPAIPSHWPSCFFGCAETICKYRFDAPPFADCDYDHTFQYVRPQGLLRRDADGTSLELTIQTVPVELSTIVERIRGVHGIGLRRRFLPSAGEFEAFAREAMRGRRVPAIIFDWFYVEGRREYRRLHAPHCMCLVGIEADGSVHLQDQYAGRLKIPGDVFAEFIEHSVRDGREGVKLIEYEQVAGFVPPRSQRLVELVRNLEFFIHNLESKESSHGLAALQAFRDETRAFMEAECAAPAVFYLPGLWQFAMQRAHFAEALQVIERLHPELSGAPRDELLRQLGVLHRCWFDLNYQAEAALLTGRPRLLAKALARLDPIIEFERTIPTLLERMLRALR